METFIKGNGRMMWHRERELILTQKEPTILVIGRMISKTVKGMRNGLMARNIKGTLRREKGMGEENLNLLMVRSMRVILKKMIYMDMVNIYGEMAKFIKVNGIITKCMGRESAFGLTENLILGNTLTIKKMVMVFLNGQMEKLMKDNGRMENNMVLEQLLILKELGGKDHGKMVNNFDLIFILIFFFFLPKLL